MKPWLSLALLLALPGSLPAADHLLLFSRSEAQAIKDAVTRKDPRVLAAAGKLRREAETRMKAGPWSVTAHRPTGTKAGLHDFFSEGPYWWPDPANPEGPYIRRDGERNPNLFTANDRDQKQMSDAVFSLGTAAWLFDEPRYAERAAKILSVWYIDPATRMSPHLEFGQAIKGITEGRGTGIIGTTALIWAVQGIYFLEATGRWKTPDREAVQKWYAEYLHWMTTSAKGLDEKKSGNNHSSWWAAQTASFAAFTGDKSALEMVWRLYREELIPKQMRPDGSCPREESRTRSLSYSVYNLAALSMVCRLAEKQGVNLWTFRAPNGAGMDAGAAYLAPFVLHPEKWQKQQITAFDHGQSYFLALAGLRLNHPEYVSAWKELPRPGTTWQLLLELLLAVRD